MNSEMMITTAVLGAFIGLVVLAALIAGFFIYVGAKLAMVEKATFGRAVLAAIGCSLVNWVFAAVLSPVPLLGSCSGFVIGLAASLVAIKVVFATSLAKALLVWVLHVFAQIVALFLALISFAGVLHSYLTLPLPIG